MLFVASIIVQRECVGHLLVVMTYALRLCRMVVRNRGYVVLRFFCYGIPKRDSSGTIDVWSGIRTPEINILNFVNLNLILKLF